MKKFICFIIIFSILLSSFSIPSFASGNDTPDWVYRYATDGTTPDMNEYDVKLYSMLIEALRPYQEDNFVSCIYYLSKAQKYFSKNNSKFSYQGINLWRDAIGGSTDGSLYPGDIVEGCFLDFIYMKIYLEASAKAGKVINPSTIKNAGRDYLKFCCNKFMLYDTTSALDWILKYCYCPSEDKHTIDQVLIDTVNDFETGTVYDHSVEPVFQPASSRYQGETIHLFSLQNMLDTSTYLYGLHDNLSEYMDNAYTLIYQALSSFNFNPSYLYMIQKSQNGGTGIQLLEITNPELVFALDRLDVNNTEKSLLSSKLPYCRVGNEQVLLDNYDVDILNSSSSAQLSNYSSLSDYWHVKSYRYYWRKSALGELQNASNTYTDLSSMNFNLYNLTLSRDGSEYFITPTLAQTGSNHAITLKNDGFTNTGLKRNAYHFEFKSFTFLDRSILASSSKKETLSSLTSYLGYVDECFLQGNVFSLYGDYYVTTFSGGYDIPTDVYNSRSISETYTFYTYNTTINNYYITNNYITNYETFITNNYETVNNYYIYNGPTEEEFQAYLKPLFDYLEELNKRVGAIQEELENSTSILERIDKKLAAILALLGIDILTDNDEPSAPENNDNLKISDILIFLVYLILFIQILLDFIMIFTSLTDWVLHLWAIEATPALLAGNESFMGVHTILHGGVAFGLERPILVFGVLSLHDFMVIIFEIAFIGAIVGLLRKKLTSFQVPDVR